MSDHITADQAAEGAGSMRVRIAATGIITGIDHYGSCLVKLDGLSLEAIAPGKYRAVEPMELPRTMVFPIDGGAAR